MSDTTLIPGRAERFATLTDALPASGETRVIGIFGRIGHRRALLHAADGATRIVAEGDLVEGRKVLVVLPDRMRLAQAAGYRDYMLVEPQPMPSSPRPRPMPPRPGTARPRAELDRA